MNHINSKMTMLRMKHLIAKLGISRSSIYEKINPKSPRYDPGFPKPIKLGGSTVAWVEEEIDQWINDSRS